jgi:AbrB family looped-hinge helix DNA binding protein
MEHRMSAATITAKGQITIPAVVRAALGVAVGDRLEFIEVDKGRFEIVAATQSVTALKGLIPRQAKQVSIEDMNQAIADRASDAAGRR